MSDPTPLVDRPLVYVAGPYTYGDPVLNTRRAINAAEGLLRNGLVTPVVPHLSMFWHLVHPRDLDWWYDYDVALLARCDALFRLAGESIGADREVAFAAERSIPTFTDAGPLESWAKGFGRELRCVALTRKGVRCLSRPMAGSDRCGPHTDQVRAR